MQNLEDHQKVYSASPSAGIFFPLVRYYLDAAELQNKRIWLDPPPKLDFGTFRDDIRNLSEAAAMMNPGDTIPAPQIDTGNLALVTARFEEIKIEVHLYFVLLDDLCKLLRKVISDEKFKGLLPQLEQLNAKWFRTYKHGRNLFEHHDERLSKLWSEGDRKYEFKLDLDLGYFQHTNNKNQDDMWDIRKAAFVDLKKDVDHLLNQVVEMSGY